MVNVAIVSGSSQATGLQRIQVAVVRLDDQLTLPLEPRSS